MEIILRAMDFDHLDERNKEYSISSLNRLSIKKHYKLLYKELEKCELVCSNCHRIRTQLRRTCNKLVN